MPQINTLLEEKKNKTSHDSIIIFEDVLYYGLGQEPDQFKEMINNLVQLSHDGHHITIAYYGIDTRMFTEVVQETRIDENYIMKLPEERIKLLGDSTWQKTKRPRERFMLADSMVSEEFFKKTREDDSASFRKMIAEFKKPLYKNDNDSKLFYQIDSIRTQVLNKPEKDILFADFYIMYREITKVIANSLTAATSYNSKFELIELRDYLVMSCWCTSEQILFALPGKYAANEIGFISHDNQIKEYIKRQLKGIKSNMNNIVNSN